MQIEELKDKKILILGFAREGKDTYNFLAAILPEKKKDKTIVILDEKLQGKDYLKAVGEYDVIFKTPGIPLSKIKPYLKKNQIVTSQTELFFDNFKGTVIGVTGTKGKGTTATLIYNILKKANKKVFLVGNIGQPVLGQYLKVKGRGEEQYIFVYELSSHQLQGLKKSPHIAVFLNLFPDHLDYYKNVNEYFTAKKSIAQFQTNSDYFIYNGKDKYAVKLAKETKAKKIDFTGDKATYETKIIGSFNQLNIKAAIGAVKVLKTPQKAILSAVEAFEGLEHRLQLVGQFNGISFYNDSMATLPEVTIAALKALPKTSVLLVGGSEKGSAYKKLAKVILKSKIKTLVILGKGTGQILVKELRKIKTVKLPQIIFADSMTDAVEYGLEKANEGEVCLLSPGAASFNMFESYQDRGEQFIKWVKHYGKKA